VNKTVSFIGTGQDNMRCKKGLTPTENTDNKRPVDWRIEMRLRATAMFVFVKSLTQANVVGLHSVGGVPLALMAGGGGGTFSSPQKKGSFSLAALVFFYSGYYLLGVSFVTNRNSHLCIFLSTQKLTVLSHSHTTRLHFSPKMYF
jgi:hypothetical protein